MPNKYYERSYRYEVKEVEHWTSLGYYSYRAHASKGDVDVYAFGPTEVVVIALTCFTDRPDTRKAKKDTERLLRITRSPGIRRLRVEYGPVVSGIKTPRKETEI